MEHSMYLIGKHISIYQKQSSTADLDEVLMGAEAFHAIAKELKKRHDS
jgi:hypothetical protein